MKPIYIGAISPGFGIFIVLALFAAVLALFVVLPALPRTPDRKGGRRFAQVRVPATFGRGVMRFGGAFYRFTLYENFVVVCLIVARSYSYRDVAVVGYDKKGGVLRLLINEMSVVLYGNACDLGGFYASLSNSIELSKR